MTTDEIMVLADEYAATEFVPYGAVKRKSLQSAIEALQKDAERYRWLTGDHPNHETRARIYTISQFVNTRSKEIFDTAIDAAMALDKR